MICKKGFLEFAILAIVIVLCVTCFDKHMGGWLTINVEPTNPDSSFINAQQAVNDGNMGAPEQSNSISNPQPNIAVVQSHNANQTSFETLTIFSSQTP